MMIRISREMMGTRTYTGTRLKDSETRKSKQTSNTGYNT